MKRTFIFAMLFMHGIFCSISAQTTSKLAHSHCGARQDYVPVAYVDAKEIDNSSIQLSWSLEGKIITTEDFETGDFSFNAWDNDLGEYPWEITTDAYEGQYAMKSTCEGVNYGTSAIEIQYTAPSDGYMGFYYKVSSEQYYDLGYFYIDGYPIAEMSGVSDWIYKQFNVTAGTHTYRWEYIKDELWNEGTDAFYIDNITFFKEDSFEGGWLHYDDGVMINMIGMGEKLPVYWGVAFPASEETAGYTLTKVALFDYEEGAANFTAYIYLGGETAPGVLAATQNFSLTGSNTIVEVPLDNPVYIDGTQTLWITFYCDELPYPCAGAAYCNDTNSDWYSFDGVEWKHAYDYNAFMSWIIRGYLEKPESKATVLTNENTETRSTNSYKVYRKNIITDVVNVIGETNDTVYYDNEWLNQETGIYQWGVSAVYQENNTTTETEVAWSNPIDKDMITKVEVSVATNTGDPADGTVVTFTSLSEEDIVFTATLEDTDIVTFDSFRKGDYKLTVEKEGFSSNTVDKTVEIWEEKEFNAVLTEIKASIENLYVSPTGYAMWDGKFIDEGDEFYYSFENGMEGWTTIDGNGDGHCWYHNTQKDEHSSTVGESHTGEGHIFSESYCLFTDAVLSPDDYIVSPKKVAIGKSSIFSFYASAIDEAFFAEHFGVAVSETGNTSTSNFKTIAEWTIDGSRQTQWTKYEVDLSEYAGQEVWIAIRHFHVSDMFILSVDDVALTTNNSDRALLKYQVKLNGDLVAEALTDPFFQHENLVDGTQYTTTVIASYTSGDSDAVEYTWTKAPEESFIGVSDLSAQWLDEKAVISWTLPEVDLPDPVSFSYGFENGMEGWTLIDNDNDGFNWNHNSSFDDDGDLTDNDDMPAHTGESCVYSESYSFNLQIALQPDNYMVAPKKFTATDESKISFWACAQHWSYPNEHIGVAVSSASNNDADDFTTIAEWTIEGDKRQTEWVKYEADLSEYAGQEIWVAIRHFNVSDEFVVVVDDIEIYIDKDNERDVVNTEILGVMMYRNGKLISHKPIEGESYTDKYGAIDDEYCVKIVYGGEKDITYYAMSDIECANVIYEMPCIAPKSLYGTPHTEGENFGALLTWPYEDSDAWMYYDDGTITNTLGTGDSGSPFYWGIMFPAEALEPYAGRSITMVSLYDCLYHNGTFYVFKGGTASPGSLVCSQRYSGTGSNEFVKYELNEAVAINGTENIWVVFRCDPGSSYPAAQSEFSGDPNGSWISLDGSTWTDVADPNVYGIPATWMIRAYAGYAKKNTTTSEAIEYIIDTNTDITLKANDNVVKSKAPTFKHYNIYRGTSTDNFQWIGTSTEGSYFDAINEDGKYYYQVKAVYEENGDTCESEAATAYNSNEKYVMVDVALSINENGVKKLMVYPNPTKDKLTINAEGLKRITIINATGQIVSDNIVNTDSETINMSQYNAGIYMIHISTETGIAVKRITVVK